MICPRQSNTCHSHKCCPEPSPGWLMPMEHVQPHLATASWLLSTLPTGRIHSCPYYLTRLEPYACMQTPACPAWSPTLHQTSSPTLSPSVALISLRAKSELLSAILRPCSLIFHRSIPPGAPAISNIHQSVLISRPVLRLFSLPLCPISLPKLLQVSFCPFLRIQLRPLREVFMGNTGLLLLWMPKTIIMCI